MAKKRFLPTLEIQMILWLINFADKLSTYAAKYGITAAEVAGIVADKEYCNFWWQHHLQVHIYDQNVTAFKNAVFYGVPAGTAAPIEPVPPVLGTVPEAVAPGVFGRSTSIGNRIKKHIDYTITDGEAMGLEGTAQSLPDLVNSKPELKTELIGGVPRIIWKKNGMKGIELLVRRNGGEWEFMVLDTHPDYDDTHPLPATEELWEYKGIYHFGNGRVGLWSEVGSVKVKA